MKECNVRRNTEQCNCSYSPCSRKGVCCECIRYHQALGELPACFFPEAAERTYDRSIGHYLRVKK